MTDKNKFTYKDLNRELEEILNDLQSNDQDLDKTLLRYKRGVEIINQLTKYLKDAELQIKKIEAR